MFSALPDCVTSWLAPLLGQSGFFTSGQGVPHGHHEPLEIGIAAILGALGGFVAGLLLAKLSRFVAYLLGRDLTTGRWAIYGAIAGAILAALWETFGE